MVQIVTSVKNTFVHVDVDSADCLMMGSNARKRASSTPARVTLNVAENETYDAHAFGAHDLKEFPLPPHDDDDDYSSMHAHPGPSALDMDVEGMLGCRVLETDIGDHPGGLSVLQLKDEAMPEFYDTGMEIDDFLREEMKETSASVPAYHGLTSGTQLSNDKYPEGLAQSVPSLNSPMMLLCEAQRQLLSTSPIPPREEQRVCYTQSFSGSAPAGLPCNADHEEPQGEENRTTVMLMNIPLRYTSSKLMDTIDAEGFATMYDFIYVPMAKARTSKSYAFVNLVNPYIAQRFVNTFNGFSRWSTTSNNTCHAVWAKQHQGLLANIGRYRNSAVMGKSVPDEYKPRVFRSGREVPFPPPNRKLSMPTQRDERPR